MNNLELKTKCLFEENFSFKGWDFSHIDGLWDSQSLPWDYSHIVKSFLKNTDNLLDMGTGGGEFLLSLNHPYLLTSVTEAYLPNIELCKNSLAPLGITVAQTYDDDKLPFDDSSFDVIINRHESFDLSEVNRTLKSGGYFITQQVGGKNNNDLSQRLIENFEPAFSSHVLDYYLEGLKSLSFEIIQSNEFFPYIRFYDIGALVYFAKIIEWEFPNFSVESCFDELCKCQIEIEEKGYIQGTEHRFLIVAKKL